MIHSDVAMWEVDFVSSSQKVQQISTSNPMNNFLRSANHEEFYLLFVNIAFVKRRKIKDKKTCDHKIEYRCSQYSFINKRRIKNYVRPVLIYGCCFNLDLQNTVHGCVTE